MSLPELHEKLKQIREKNVRLDEARKRMNVLKEEKKDEKK